MNCSLSAVTCNCGIATDLKWLISRRIRSGRYTCSKSTVGLMWANFLRVNYTAWALYFISAVMTIATIRLSACLPQYREGSKRKSKKNESVSTLVFWDSGGHTTEMIRLISNLPPTDTGQCILWNHIRTQQVKIKFLLLTCHPQAMSFGVLSIGVEKFGSLGCLQYSRAFTV